MKLGAVSTRDFHKIAVGVAEIKSLLTQRRRLTPPSLVSAPRGHHFLPNAREIVAISFWDHKENAEAYNSTGYPEVLKILAKSVDGTPHVRVFDVVSSTSQKSAARVAA